jgi:pseudaminic acid cytidylyltransferase
MCAVECVIFFKLKFFTMANLAIIPARGGSKRIPRKNIKFFLGKPIIAYSIEVAIKSGLFDEIMVSTDDNEIAKVGMTYGAKIPFYRSALNSNDFATTMDVIDEVLNEYSSRDKYFENVCCIYPTAPLINVDDLLNGYEILTKNKEIDVVYPITNFSYPILRSLIIEEHGNVKMKWPEYQKTRSQDLQPAYHDCGQWYWYSMESLNKRDFSIIKPIILDGFRVQDIDNEEDWKLAEMKYKFNNNFI